jgi:hypothetical protein
MVFGHPIRSVFIALCVVGLIWAIGSIDVLATPHNFYQFGVVGITRGQTARLNVANVASQQEVRVEMSIVDSNNKTLARSVETIQPGQSNYLDLDTSTFIGAAGDRVLIQAIVRDLREPQDSQNDIIPSFEIFETTSGKTLTLYAPPIGEIHRQDTPISESGMLGIGRGQTARLTVTYSYWDNPVAPPVKVQLLFLGQSGEIVAKTTQTLSPGVSAFLDVRAYKLNLSERQRAQLRVAVRPVQMPEAHRPVFLTTYEVFTTRTGATDVLYPSEIKQQIPNQSQ